VLALLTAAIVTGLLSSTSVAYSLQNAGFTVTDYNIGFTAGPRASAWEGNILWSVAADGLYKADSSPGGPGPATTIAATRVSAVPMAGLSGVTVTSDGRLYATNMVTEEIVELDKTDGHVIRTLGTGSPIQPRALAADPLSGDLIVSGSSRLWRVSTGVATTATVYTKMIPSGIATKAIQIGADGTMFVVSDSGALYWIESTALAALHPGVDAVASSIGPPVAGATVAGVAIITNGLTPVAQFLLVTTDGGAVYKVSGLASTAAPILVLNGAGPGQQISTGPDRCAYPAMGGVIIRVADASGFCALSLAGVIPPTLSLANTTGQDPHIGVTQTVRATLANASVPSGNDVTFTIEGVNRQTVHAFTNASGTAQFSYTSAVIGADTIVATATVDGFPLVSNAVAIDWLRAVDLSTPTIAYTMTVPAGGQGTTNFACDQTITSDTQNSVACGWYTKYPTVHFTVTPHGLSGISPTTSCGDYILNYQPGPEGHHQTCAVINGDGFGPATLTVIINAVLTPPSLTPQATVDGGAYVTSTPTNKTVTVHYVCTSVIPTGLSCPADQTFNTDGSFSASATATDIAGQTTTATFGSVVIDLTPPTITPSYGSYVPGTWTNRNVSLSFTCSDNIAVATCPESQTVSADKPGGVTVSATDTAGNTGTATTQPIRIDKTGPSIVATAKKADGSPYVPGAPTNQNVTVHFACTANLAPIGTCPSDQLVTATGTATGSITDAAGNSASATLAVIIDRTDPTISAAVTVGGVAYDGLWTHGPVLVHWTCNDDKPGWQCPADETLIADRNGPVSGTVTDAAGNTASFTTAAIKIDNTAPATIATVSGTSGGPGIFLLSASVGLAATDAGSGVASVIYKIDGGAAVTVSGAAASFVVSTASAHTITYHATDVAGNVEADRTVSFTIVVKQKTALAITSSPFLATGTKASARLTTDGGTPIAGATITLKAGTVTKTALTDASGVASVDLGLTPGAYTLAASYAGTASYFPSEASAQSLVAYAMTKFVVYAPNATLGASVQFWGSQWTKQIANKDIRKGFTSFKGLADAVFDAYWTARSDDEVKAPASLPQYIGVILTTKASSKSEDTISGDVAGVAVLRVAACAPSEDRSREGGGDGKDKTESKKSGGDSSDWRDASSKDGRDGKDPSSKDGNDPNGGKAGSGCAGRLGDPALGTVLNIVRR
jgi:hypothetical protein